MFHVRRIKVAQSTYLDFDNNRDEASPPYRIPSQPNHSAPMRR